MRRRSAEATLAVLFAAAIVLVGAAAIYFFSTISYIHPDPAAVPSTAADVQCRAVLGRRRGIQAPGALAAGG